MKIHEITENVGTAFQIGSNVASAGQLGAKAAGKKGVAGKLGAASKIAGAASDIAQIVAGTAGPLMIAGAVLDVVRMVGTTDREFVEKIKKAKAQAELRKKSVKFTHPAELPGPAKIANHIADLFGGKLEGSYVVTAQGELKYDPSPEERKLAQRLATGDEETGAEKFSGTGGLY